MEKKKRENCEERRTTEDVWAAYCKKLMYLSLFDLPIAFMEEGHEKDQVLTVGLFQSIRVERRRPTFLGRLIQRIGIFSGFVLVRENENILPDRLKEAKQSLYQVACGINPYVSNQNSETEITITRNKISSNEEMETLTVRYPKEADVRVEVRTNWQRDGVWMRVTAPRYLLSSLFVSGDFEPAFI